MAKSRAQQAAIAISMKKASKKPKSMPKAQRGAAVDSLWKTAKVTPARMSTGYPEGMSKPKSAPVRMTERPKEMPSNLKNRKLTTDPVSGGIQYKTGGSTPAWTRKEGKNPTGGLNAKGVASYRAANPGSKLQTAVTTKPSKLKAGSKDAKRRKSFCARMSGMPGPMKDEKGRPTRKALSLRKWNC
jgi:hypothetical protein